MVTVTVLMLTVAYVLAIDGHHDRVHYCMMYKTLT